MRALNPLYQGNMGQRTGLSYENIKAINLAYCADRSAIQQCCNTSVRLSVPSEWCILYTCTVTRTLKRFIFMRDINVKRWRKNILKTFKNVKNVKNEKLKKTFKNVIKTFVICQCKIL